MVARNERLRKRELACVLGVVVCVQVLVTTYSIQSYCGAKDESNECPQSTQQLSPEGEMTMFQYLKHLPPDGRQKAADYLSRLSLQDNNPLAPKNSPQTGVVVRAKPPPPPKSRSRPTSAVCEPFKGKGKKVMMGGIPGASMTEDQFSKGSTFYSGYARASRCGSLSSLLCAVAGEMC